MKKLNQLRRRINNSNVSRFRIWIQLISFVLIIYGGYFYIHIGSQVPTFACPYNNGSSGTCYLIAIQHGLHLTWKELTSFRGLALLSGLLTFLLFFILLNKAWCGFVCPLGTIQDWITKLRFQLGIRFSKYDNMAFHHLKKVKYVFLVLLIAIPLGMSNRFFGLPPINHDMQAPFCQVCPGRTVLPLFSADTSQFFIDFSSKTSMVMSTIGMLFTALFFVGSFVKKRFFCFFCPMSASQFIFSRASVLRLTKEGDKCTKCGNCYHVCDVGIIAIAEDVSSKYIVKDDCMMCFKCVEACPEEGCLDVKVFSAKIFSSTQEGFFKRNLLSTTPEDQNKTP